MDSNLAAVFALSPSDKMQLIGDLWDDLSRTPEVVPVPDWQIEEIERRKAHLAGDPTSGLSWDKVERRIRSRHGK